MSHKVKILFYVSALVIVGILSGCQPSKVSESITPLPTPNPTEGIVSGTLVDMDGKPIQNIPVRMAQVYRQVKKELLSLTQLTALVRLLHRKAISS